MVAPDEVGDRRATVGLANRAQSMPRSALSVARQVILPALVCLCAVATVTARRATLIHGPAINDVASLRSSTPSDDSSAALAHASETAWVAISARESSDAWLAILLGLVAFWARGLSRLCARVLQPRPVSVCSIPPRPG